MLEFSDLLKRPLDAFQYLQLSIETGEVALTQQNVQLNCVMIGSANELHLDAFREHPEFASFRGRLELDSHAVPPELRAGAGHLRHARGAAGQAPHRAARDARRGHVRGPDAHAEAERRPLPAPRRPGDLGGLTAVEKMELYATGRAPSRLDREAQKLVARA